MKKIIIWVWVLSLLLSATGVRADSAATYVARIASLIEPAKLATLGKRAANPRVQKYVAQLAEARFAGNNPTNVANEAVTKAGMTGTGAKLTSDAMLRNLTIADRLGCLDVEGLSEMRKGKAPTVRRGPYAGDQLSVDHSLAESPEAQIWSALTSAGLREAQRKTNRRMSDKNRGSVRTSWRGKCTSTLSCQFALTLRGNGHRSDRHGRNRFSLLGRSTNSHK